MKNGVILDEWKKRIGLRTVTMCTEKDEYGECFAHQVNGMNIFAMGADYIPEDAILSRMSGERTRELLQQAKNANFNCIRVWGGGHYPSDDFWDACDELGLLVWQDFMFACAVYDLTDEFEENIIHEFEDNIKRIRHHASLGLWCGNNEMELFVDGGEWVTRPKQKSDYVKMYEYIIPKVLKNMIPIHFTGRQVHHQAEHLTILMMKIAVMYIIGKYGMETGLLQNIVNIFSDTCLNLDSSLFLH